MGWRPEAQLAGLLGLTVDELAERRIRSHYADRDKPLAAPVVTLPGLFETPWVSLAGSYGPATFVPLYLEALSSPHGPDRAWGEDALSASMNHQGHPAPDAVHVVPFLFALLEERVLPEPALVLTLLIELAVGDPDWCLQRGVDVDDFPRTSCHDTVVEGGTRFVRWLGAESPGVRATAAEACALVGPPAGALEPLLVMAERDVDPGVRLQARIAASVVARRQGRDVELGDAGEDLVERASGLAARAYALAAGLPDTDRNALRRLADELEVDGSAMPAHLTWDLPRTLRRQWVTLAVPADLDGQLAHLEAGGGDPEVRSEIALRVTQETFADFPRDRPVRAMDVSEAARRFVRCLRDDQALVYAVFMSVGMPRSLPAGESGLARWLAEETTPLTQALALPGGPAPTWWALDAFLRGELTDAAIGDALVRADVDALALAKEVLEESRWLTSLGDHRELRAVARNDLASRLVLFLAPIVADAAGGLGWAEEVAREALARVKAEGDEPPRDAPLGTWLALLVLARLADGGKLDPAYEPLLSRSHAPVSTFARAVGAVLRHLPDDAQSRWLARVPLHHVSRIQRAVPDGDGKMIVAQSASYIRFSSWWSVLPTLPRAAVAERVLEEVRAYEAHRRRSRAHPDHDRLGGRDHEFPWDEARRLLAGPDGEAALARVADQLGAEARRKLASG